MIEDVAAFHSKFGVPVETVPRVPAEERIMLRFRLVQEEYEELIQAMGVEECGPPGETWWEANQKKTHLPETADAIADLIYVLIGTAHEMGIPLQAVWDRVQAANMAKVGGGQDAKGKVMKPPGWIAPDIAGVLRDHGWKGQQ
jgi:predicted HAD superfamily Cof-like phosphohydrolase